MEGAAKGNSHYGQVIVMMSSVILAGLALIAAAPRTTIQKSAPRKASVVRAAKVSTPAPVQTAFRRSPYVGAIVADAKNGNVLFQSAADQPAYPASVTKLMTLLLVLEDVRVGKYRMTDMVTATPDVYRCEPSWVGIKVGESMSVGDLCTSLMVESANDAAIALGVHSAGSFEAFVVRMNARAAELGMKNTKYYNPNGLPPNARRRYPWKSFNVSTASDQLKLALRLVKMPETFAFTSIKTCDLVKSENGYRVSVTRKVNEPLKQTQLQPGEKVVKQMRNHNHVMVQDKLKIYNSDGSEAVDGLKTGYIDAGGSSVVLTAHKGDKRVVVVVLGSATAKERDENARSLAADALGSIAW